MKRTIPINYLTNYFESVKLVVIFDKNTYITVKLEMMMLSEIKNECIINVLNFG